MKEIVKKGLLLFVVILFSSTVLAGNNDELKDGEKTVKITGKVIDAETGEVLTGVKVFFEGSDEAVYTDFDGEFNLEAKVKKDAQLTISLISYKAENLKVEDSNLTIKLKKIK